MRQRLPTRLNQMAKRNVSIEQSTSRFDLCSITPISPTLSGLKQQLQLRTPGIDFQAALSMIKSLLNFGFVARLIMMTSEDCEHLAVLSMRMYQSSDVL